MQETLENFLRALRSVDVRVSPVEAIDAHNTVDAVGFTDRQLLKDSLCVALAKTSDEVTAFDECFDIFFSREEFRDQVEKDHEKQELIDQNMEMIADNPLAQLMLQGSRQEIAQAMEYAANAAGVANIQYGTQRGLFTRRLLDRMGLRSLESLTAQLKKQEGDGAEAMAQRLEDARQELFGEARKYMDRQFELYAKLAGEKLREEFLQQTSLSAIERRDMKRMQSMVRRMAKRLASKYNKRKKHTNSGVLDVRRTLRKSMAHDGIPFETVWKSVKVERPKIVVICDVSQSVAAAARFLLLFLYSLNEVIAKLHAYAFSSRLIEISDILQNRTIEQAIPEVLEKVGFRPTDYGQALDDLVENHMDAIDRRTTIIMLGDGRSNNTDPRMDLMRRLHDCSKSVIWLNPEPETFWGTGDSEMHRYKRFCHVAKVCNTVKDLEYIIDDVLKSYFRT